MARPVILLPCAHSLPSGLDGIHLDQSAPPPAKAWRSSGLVAICRVVYAAHLLLGAAGWSVGRRRRRPDAGRAPAARPQAARIGIRPAQELPRLAANADAQQNGASSGGAAALQPVRQPTARWPTCRSLIRPRR